jgi:formylglycine-generating enzyme required for sulfatase activity
MNRVTLALIVFIQSAVVCLAGSTNTITDINGDTIKVQLSGPGTFTYTLVNVTNGPIDQIFLHDTTTNSTLAITVKKSSTGTGITDINAIVGAGALKKLDAKKVNLVGTGLVLGRSVSQVFLNNLTNSGIAIAAELLPDGQPGLGKLTCNAIIGSRIQVGGDIGKVQVGRMIDSDLWAAFVPKDESDPMAGGSFTNNTTITDIKIKGVSGASTPAFINSTIAGRTLGKINIASINTNNLGRAFGVLGATFTKDIVVKVPQFKRKPDAGVVEAIGDFAVRQLFSPVATTDAALGVTDTTATLTASINANGLVTFAYFEWGTTTDYGFTTPVELIGSSTNSIYYTAPITGLTAGETYHFRIVASSSNGTAPGADQDFVARVPVITPNNMALIPGGVFQMGDALDEGSVTEQPVHLVPVSTFLIDQTEVTEAHWDTVRAWAGSRGYQFDKPGYSLGPDYPVGWVSWYDAIKWCNARSEMEGLTPCYYTNAAQTNVYRTGQEGITNSCVNWNATGYRLPTEAEWEKAARGGARGLRFPWGNTIAHVQATYFSVDIFPYDISITRYYNPLYYTGVAPYTSPVGSHPANGYGLYDMTGNLWEWCWDWNEYLWYQNPAATELDPIGPDNGKYRCVRGGGWLTNAELSRVSYRDYFLRPYEATISIGFRCVRRPAVE